MRIKNRVCGGETAMQTEEKTLYQLDGVMIGKRIKSVRKAKGLTQGQLAERCGCTSTHISNIENGKIGISIELLYIEEQILFLIKHNPRITQVQIAY